MMDLLAEKGGGLNGETAKFNKSFGICLTILTDLCILLLIIGGLWAVCAG